MMPMGIANNIKIANTESVFLSQMVTPLTLVGICINEYLKKKPDFNVYFNEFRFLVHLVESSEYVYKTLSWLC